MDSEDLRPNQSCWLTWVDEDGHWFDPFKPILTNWNYFKKLLDFNKNYS